MPSGFHWKPYSIPERWPSGRRCVTGNHVCGQPYRGFESLPFRQHQVQELPLKLLKSRAKRGIYSFAAIFDSVRECYCSPGSGSICWYIVGTFFIYFLLVPTFFYFGFVNFLLGWYIWLTPTWFTFLIFFPPQGLHPFQGHPRFPQGFVFLASHSYLYFRRKCHE